VKIGDEAGGYGTDVEISERHTNKGNPSEFWMVVIQDRNLGPQFVTHWMLREVLQATANGVAASVARE
jgi:hypothetical protein